MKTVAVIGGGAAGMMAASAAADLAHENGQACRILLFEKNAYLGAKVIISGGGRCNVTTGIFEVRELLKNYPRGAKFLMTAMYRLPPEKVMMWFEDHGVPLKIEEDLRVFPKSDNGKDVVGALEKELRENGVEIFCNAAVADVTRTANGAHEVGKFHLSLKDGRTFDVDKLILTTGGSAYRHTGSTGDGYAFAQALGHTITPLAASLSSFLVKEEFLRGLAGVSFEKVKLTLAANTENKTAKNFFERTGAFIFTHKGISGPAVFALSAYAAYEKISPEFPQNLLVDFFPDERLEKFDEQLHHLIQKNPKKKLENFLDILLPKSLCAVIISLLKLPPELLAANINKQQRQSVARLLKEFPLTLIGRSAGEEFVTAGGVALDEVNTNTMESKICPGLYFAGELLDVDGFTGGFNLQASWATGALAGSSAGGISH